MKTKNSYRSTKSKKLIIFALIVLALAITLFILEITNTTHFLNSPNVKTTNQKQEDAANTTKKQEFIDSDTTSNSGSSTSPKLSEISLSTRREVDGNITITTQLKNYSDGNCILTIKNGVDVYTQTATVLYQPYFSACRGFSVPSNAVGSGTWQISLSVISKGKTNTKTISLEVK